MNELVITEELKGLDPSKAAQIKAVFHPMVEMLESFESAYNDVMAQEQSYEKCAQAKRLRLDIAKIRIVADKVRKEQKDEYLRAGNAIQGVYNILKFAVTDKEEKLQDVESFYERIEAEKIARLQIARVEELNKYNVDGSSIDLGSMDEQIWTNFLAGSKAQYEAVLLAEQKAEEARLEAIRIQQEENERIRKENEALRIEQEKAREEAKKQEAILQAERAKADAERKAQEDLIRKERDAREAIERKIATEKAEAEQKAREEAAKLKADQKAAALAPDKEKLLAVGAHILNAVDTVKAPEAKDALKRAYDVISLFVKSL